MKKILLAASVIVLSMTACKKDRVCECTLSQTVTNNNNSNTSSATNDYTIVKVSKRTAKLACIHTKGTDVNNNVTITYDNDCKLK